MEKLKIILMGSRSFSGRDGKKFSALAMLDITHGRFVQMSVPDEMLANAGVEQPSMTEVLEVELEDNGFSKKIVGFKTTDETYTINTLV